MRSNFFHRWCTSYPAARPTAPFILAGFVTAGCATPSTVELRCHDPLTRDVLVHQCVAPFPAALEVGPGEYVTYDGYTVYGVCTSTWDERRCPVIGRPRFDAVAPER